eukprot:sb/3470676/
MLVRWKRKKLSGPTSSAFTEEDEEEEDYSNKIIPFKKQCFALEDRVTIIERLKREGNILAEAGRYWEALSKFGESIVLCKEDMDQSSTDHTRTLSVLYELSAQCYSELAEVFPAAFAAEKSVHFDITCPVARQTLARAQINIGELGMAKVTIQKSIILDPAAIDTWNDLREIQELVRKRDETSWTSLPVTTRPGIVCQRE